MKSWKKGAPLELCELPLPQPKAGEVRVKVAASGVNPVDWKMRDGGPLGLALRIIGPPLPFVPGIDFAGTVEAVGEGVTTLKPGDRVVGGTDFSKKQRGSYAEYVVASEGAVCTLPDNVSFETAGAMPVAGVTAWMSLMELGGLAARPAGTPVLVLGAAGGVGQFAVQIARMQGAKVVAVCSAKNADLVRDLGADVVLDYNAGDVLAAAKAHGPFGIVVDVVGSYSPSGCRALLVKGGRHVIVSGENVKTLVQPFIPPFTSKTVLGRSTTARLRAVVDGIAAGKIRVAIAERLPLADAEQAHAQSRTSRTAGKIVLLP